MKRIALVVFIFLSLLLISGCNCINIVFNDNAESLLKEDFVENNKISGAFYTKYFEENEIPESIGSDLIHDESGYYTVFYQYEDNPRERQFIIESEDSYNLIFKEDNDLEIDFDKQKIVLYTYVCYYKKVFYFDKSIVKDDTLEVYYYRYHKKLTGDTSNPYQRWIYIICDKDEITNYKFIYYEIEID